MYLLKQVANSCLYIVYVGSLVALVLQQLPALCETTKTILFFGGINRWDDLPVAAVGCFQRRHIGRYRAEHRRIDK